MNNEKKPGEESNREIESHDQNQRHPNWGDDKRKKDPKYEALRSENQQESQEKFEDHNAKSKGISGESTHPDHKKDTQSNQSKDPTRKNEANQGTSDLRKRERTTFKREGESKDTKE